MTEEIKRREELYTYISFGDGEGGTGGERRVGQRGKRRGTGDRFHQVTPGWAVSRRRLAEDKICWRTLGWAVGEATGTGDKIHWRTPGWAVRQQRGTGGEPRKLHCRTPSLSAVITR